MKSKTSEKDKKDKKPTSPLKLLRDALGCSQSPATKQSKKLRKWIKEQNQIALQQPMKFEPELAKLAQQTIEQHHPDLVWDTSRPMTLGRVIANTIPQDSTPDPVVSAANSKMAQAFVAGITDHVQKIVEDALIDTLSPLVYKYGPVVAKRALKGLDEEIVDFILEKQIQQKQLAIAEIEKQTTHLQKWKQTPTPSEQTK